MEQEYTFKVTGKEADTLFEALVELPFKKVVDIFFKLRQQVSESVQWTVNTWSDRFYKEQVCLNSTGVR